VAVLGELANLTPANVRLTNVLAKLAATGKPTAGAKAENAKRSLVIEGIVMGDRMTLESDLAGFLMTLKSSPLFKQPSISKKSFETVDDQQVIRFTAQMDLV
jgi:hypothetical protein